IGTAPNLCFVPTVGFSGEDWFAYEANDGVHHFARSVKISISASYTLPLGVPAPDFGVAESHMMYVGATYFFDGLGDPVGYQDAGNGPYTHYVDFNNGSDTNNPFGTAANPRRSVPPNLLPGSVVELHGTNINSQTRFTFSGQGSPSQPIFIRGANAFS